MKGAKTVDAYLEDNIRWVDVLIWLRKHILETGLQESIKWGIPVYTYQGKNIVGIAAFMNYVGIWFYQGVFIEDTYGKLINAQKGKTKALRQWRITSMEEANPVILADYINQAVRNEIAGKRLKPEKRILVVPDLLQDALNKDEQLKNAFAQFSPGKQHEFAAYILDAKKAATQQSRLKKMIPLILQGIGLNDKYRKK